MTARWGPAGAVSLGSASEQDRREKYEDPCSNGVSHHCVCHKRTYHRPSTKIKLSLIAYVKLKVSADVRISNILVRHGLAQ